MERIWIGIIAVLIYVLYLTVKAICKKIRKFRDKLEVPKYDVPYREMKHPRRTGKHVNLEYAESMKKAGVFEDDKKEKSHVQEDTISDYEYFSQDSQKDNSSAVYCPACGTRDWDHNAFCKKCGTSLRNDDEKALDEAYASYSEHHTSTESSNNSDNTNDSTTYTVFYDE